MSSMASQITSLTIVYSNVYSGSDQRKYQSSASLAFVRGIHRRPVNSPHKLPVTRKMFPFDDVISLTYFSQLIAASATEEVLVKQVVIWSLFHSMIRWRRMVENTIHNLANSTFPEPESFDFVVLFQWNYHISSTYLLQAFRWCIAFNPDGCNYRIQLNKLETIYHEA